MTFDTKMYFSGTVELEVNKYMIERDVHRLATFAYPKEATEYLNLANEAGKRVRLIVDSGAFTAWNVGKPVQLRDLIDYNENLVNKYGHQHDLMFISLDVIPGDRGRRPGAEELAKGIEQSYANFKEMQQHFPRNKVLPVYHSGEDVNLRNAYLQLTDYVCLSMDQTMSESHRLEWAKRSVVPGFYFHGLAATGNRMVSQIGWYSVDSSSWITVGAMGGILWPTTKNAFRILSLSEESPARHTANEHLFTLAPAMQEAAKRYILEQGFDWEKLSKNYTERRKWNVHMWCNPPWIKTPVKAMDLFS